MEWHDIGLLILGVIIGILATGIWSVIIAPILRASGFPI